MATSSALQRIGLFLYLVALADASIAAASVDRDPVAGPRPRVTLARGKPATDGVRAVLDAAAYEAMLRSREVVVSDFPLPGGRHVDLELTRFEIAPRGARFVVVDEGGPRDVASPAFHAFRGRVAGDPHSSVTLSLFGDRIGGVVRLDDGEFVVEPETFEAAQATPSTIRVRPREADPDRPDTSLCATDDLERPADSLVADAGHSTGALSAIDGDTLLEATVAIDATFEWFERFGSVTAAQNYILNLMAQVSDIYESEVNVRIVVSYLRVFSTPADPYTDTTDTTTLLAELRNEWNLHQTSIERTTVHLFSAKPSGGAGIAYVDVLCHHVQQPGNSYDYGVSTLSANGGSWEKELVAHEIGHNFSSPHTHCYVPEIDRCATAPGCYSGPVEASVGTIMSYCSAASPVFHSRVENERIRPAAEAAHPMCISVVPGEEPPLPPQDLTVD